jgi:RNA polymerase sigma-70 factor (ECF subfamily)
VCAACPAELARDVDRGFGTFVAHHQDLVYGLARRWSRTPSDAEDLAQDAFVRAYRALKGYDAERVSVLHMRGWMSRIVLNLARNRARRADPVETSLDPAADPTHDPADIDTSGRPELVTERREATREWTALLGQLPARYRVAVELRHVEGLSYGELAEALGRPVGTVKSDVHRGVAMLRDAWNSRNHER